MKARNHGIAVLYLETDLENTPHFDENSLTEMQASVFLRLSENEQEKIRAGYATRIIDLESGNCICDFNTEGYVPPKHSIDSFARSILPMIQEFYEDPKNREAFENWQREQNKGK